MLGLFLLAWIFSTSCLGAYHLGRAVADVVLGWSMKKRARARLQVAAGEVLDAIGDHYGVRRRIEPDAEYRERIHSSLRFWQ